MRSGIVVAGGRSARIGKRDGTLVEVGGVPRLRRATDRDGAVVDEVVVNCRAGQVGPIRRALDGASPAPRFAIDDAPDRGPVAGLAEGLRVANAPGAVAIGADLPAVDPELLDRLIEAIDDRAAAVPVVDGHRRPLPAAYRVETAHEACLAALVAGDGALRDVLCRLDSISLPEKRVREWAAVGTLRSVETPGDRRAVEQDPDADE